MADINDLKDICISSSTLRAEDLLPRFMGILKDYAPEKFNEFIKGYPELDGWEDFLEADWRIISDDTKMNASDDLFGLLNDIAPEGTMFSSTEGDGADFGFWSVEEKLLDDDEGEKALKQMAKDGKSTGEVAADIRYDVATALDMTVDKAEDLMTKFGLDKIYVLRAQGLSPKAIAKKILKACESKDEGWLGGFYSRQDVLDAMDGGILNKDWKLEKRFGNWGCYVNQDTGRPLVLQVMVSQDRNGDWGYKPVTSDMGPVDTNIQAAKWLKPRLEEWVEKNPDLAKDVPDYEWGWIEKCLGKETANKDRKNLVSSLVKGDKIKLIDTVADGAVVTFIDMITPTKMRILHNGREMSCKTSYIDRKVEESKSEATRYYGYGKDDAIDKEDNDFMWQVAYDWFVDKLPEKLTQYADKAVIDIIDKDSRAYEEIVTMDDYYDYLETYGPAVIEEITGGFSESKKKENLTDKEEHEWYRFWFDDVKKHIVPGKSGYVEHNCKMLPYSDVRQMWGVAAMAKELCDNFRRYLSYRGYTNSKGSPFAEISWRAEDAGDLLTAMNKADGSSSESKKTESSGADLASIYGDGDVSTHENSADGFYVDERDPMGFAVLNNDTATMEELFSGKAVAPEKPWTYAGWHEDTDAPENEDGSYPYVYDWEREYDLNFVNDWKRVVGDKNNEKALELLLKYAPDFIPAAMDFWNAFHAGYSKGLLRKLFNNIFAVVDKDDPDNNYLGYGDYTYDEVAKFLGSKDESKKKESISGKLLLDPEKFEKAIRDVIDSEKEDILKSVDDDEREYYEMAFETLGESDYDYAGELCKRLQDDMLKYVSGNDYRIMGNFNNIESDWNHDHEDGIKFQDLRKKLLDGVKDADTDEFSIWAIDWFFDTFGTYNMCYKYHDTVSDLAYSYQQEDERNGDADESKKSESLTLKQKELKDMARYGEAEDITTISDAEAKELKKKGIETVGVSRGTYGMNGAHLRDREGNKYVITARSSNLFYFV